MAKRFNTNPDKVISICKNFGIENYYLNNDGSIDVFGNVDLSGKNLNRIPIKFRVVGGNFDIRKNCLTSLFGCPATITGDFFCQFNFLASLRFGPKAVNGKYFCSYNILKDLAGVPPTFLNDLICNNNRLSSLKNSPRCVRNLDISHNPLKHLAGMPIVLEDLTCYGNDLENLGNDSTIYGAIYAEENLKLQYDRRMAIDQILS